MGENQNIVYISRDTTQCPICFGEIEGRDKKRGTFFCLYCGQRLAIGINPAINNNTGFQNNSMDGQNSLSQPVMTAVQPVQGSVNQQPVMAVAQPVQGFMNQQAVKDDNTLIIDFASVDSRVKLITRLVQTGYKDVIISGQTKKYRLAPGQYTIVLKIGKINYNRDFVIPETKEPVQIHCSWNKRAGISIEQPYVESMASSFAGNDNPDNNNRSGNSKPAASPSKPTKSEEEMTYVEMIFRKATIAPWIISGMLAFMGMTTIFSRPLGGVLCILAAIVMNPLLTEFIASKLDMKFRIPLRIGCFILAGIIFSIGFCGRSKSNSAQYDQSTNDNIYNSYLSEYDSAMSKMQAEADSYSSKADENTSEYNFSWSDLFGGNEKENETSENKSITAETQPGAPEMRASSESYSIDTDKTYAFMPNDTDVYFAIPVTSSAIKIERWNRTIMPQREMSFYKEIGTFKLDDSQNGFYWLDDEHSAFVFNLTDKDNWNLKKKKMSVFTINTSDSDLYKGTDFNEDIACYTYVNDEEHEYKAMALTKNLIKIEAWYKPLTISDSIYGYDLLLINPDGNETDFAWGDDNHKAFTVTLDDSKNRFYWKSDKFVSFTLSNPEYKYATVMDYLENRDLEEKGKKTGEEKTSEGKIEEDKSNENNTVENKPEENKTEENKKNVFYSTNDEETAKNGNSGVYAYKDNGPNYDIYYIIDFDEGFAYYFTEGNGEESYMKIKIDSGDLNSGLKITFHDGGDTWSEKLKFKVRKQPETLVLKDQWGEYEYKATDLEKAVKLRDSKKLYDVSK